MINVYKNEPVDSPRKNELPSMPISNLVAQSKLKSVIKFLIGLSVSI